MKPHQNTKRKYLHRILNLIYQEKKYTNCKVVWCMKIGTQSVSKSALNMQELFVYPGNDQSIQLKKKRFLLSQ